MICKWCGNPLTAADRTCRRCGREVPARSDCGGFYDLVPNARQPHSGNTVPGQNVHRPQTPPVPYYSREGENARQRKNSSPQRMVMMILAAACFLLVLVLLFSINSKVKKCLDILQNDGPEAAFFAGEQVPAAEPAPGAAKETERTAPEAAAPDQLIAPEKEESQTVPETTPWDPGTEATEAVSRFSVSHEDVKVEVTLQGEGGEELPIENIEPIPGGMLIRLGDRELKLTYETQTEEDGSSCIVTYDFSADTVQWQYLTDEADSWMNFPEESVEQSRQDGQTVLRFSDEDLMKLAGEGELQLRCCLEGTDEVGTVRIVVTGFRWQKGQEEATPNTVF